MKHSLDHPITASFMLRFSLPTIISMVFMGIYTTVDGVFVSQLVGTDALSSVNIILPLINAAIAIGTMFGTGGNAIVAKRLGEGKEKTARENFSLIIVSAFLVSLVFTFLGLAFMEPMIRFLGADESLFSYCYDYALYTLIFVAPCILASVFQVFFITAGHASLGLAFSVAGGLSNMVLDYVLIKTFQLGIAGAAIATGMSYTIPALAGLIFFSANRKGHLFFIKPHFDFQVLKRTCTNGISEMVTNLSLSVVTLLFNKILMNMAGSDGVASITIILYVQFLLCSIYLGYSLGIAPVISYNYGRRDTERLKKLYHLSLRIISITSVVTFAISLAFASPLVEIFSPKGSSVYTMAVHGFQLFAACFLFMGFTIFGSSMFTALSDGITSALLSFLRTLVFVVAALLLLPQLIGIDGVWLAVPLAEFLGLLVTFFFFHRKKKIYHYA